MEEDQFSSSEEVDEEELEVALYSQIHFDPVVESFAQTTKDFFPNFVQPSFQVGVKSFLSKKLKNKRVLAKETEAKNSSVFTLDFISFTGDASKSEVSNDPENNSQVKESSQEVVETPQSGLQTVDCLILDHHQDTTCVDTPSIIQQNEKKENKDADNAWSGFIDDDDSCLLVAVTAVDESIDLVPIIEPEVKGQPSVSNKAKVSNNPGIGGKPVASNEPALGNKPAVDNKPGVGNKSALGNKPALDNKPALGNKPALDNKPGVGNKPALSNKPAVGSKPAISNEPGVRAKPAVRDAGLNTVKVKGSQKDETKPVDTISRENVPARSKNVSDEPMPQGLFSFSITKTPRNVSKSSSPTPQEKCVADVKGKSEKKRTQKSMAAEPTTKKKKISKLAEFLSIASEKTASDIEKEAKKKRVSKQEAAVQPRKPVILKKRAPTVVVQYHQHSDTNTDYSDSEESNTFSPVKVPKKSDTSKSKISSVKIPDKLNLQPQSDSGDSSSDEEGEIVEEKTSTNFETRKKDDEIVEKSSESEDEEDDKFDKENKDANEVDPDSGSSGEVENSSETSSSSDEGDIDMESGLITQSGLDFNLTVGVESLLKTPTTKDSSDGKKWSIEAQDRSGPSKSLTNRYFNPKKIKCRNCDQEGHLAIACPEPKKIVCIMCGVKGHHYVKCPNAICYNCNSPGHRSMDCPKPKKNWREDCERCWMQGHSKDDCPDLWRQYHCTVGLDSKTIVKSKEKKNPKMFCFNCGWKGHLGYECRAERIDRFVQLSFPFVAQYDKLKIEREKRDPDKRNECKERRNERDDVGRKRKAEKSDNWDRKVSRRTKEDTHCIANVDNLNIRIEQHQSASLRAPNKTASRRSERKDVTTSRDRAESFVSGSTVFQYQEPSDPKFSSQGQPTSSKPFSADHFQHPMNSDFNDDQFVENSMERYSNRNHYDRTQEDRKEVPRSKSRKAKQRQRKQLDDQELVEDMNRHQVSHNEWWNDEAEYEDFEVPETSVRKNKHAKKNLKRKNNSAAPSPSTSYAESSMYSSRGKSRGRSVHAEYPRHRPYHHKQHSQNQYHRQSEYAEDYISLNSRPSHNRSNSNSSSYHCNKKKRKDNSQGKRNIGNNGFRAREWVKSLY